MLTKLHIIIPVEGELSLACIVCFLGATVLRFAKDCAGLVVNTFFCEADIAIGVHDGHLADDGAVIDQRVRGGCDGMAVLRPSQAVSTHAWRTEIEVEMIICNVIR